MAIFTFQIGNFRIKIGHLDLAKVFVSFIFIGPQYKKCIFVRELRKFE